MFQSTEYLPLKTMKQHYGEAAVFWNKKGCDITFKANTLNVGNLLKEFNKIKRDLEENYI